PVLSPEPAKPPKRMGLTDAHIFLNRLINIDYSSLPGSLQATLQDTLIDWSNYAPAQPGDIVDFEQLRALAADRINRAKQEDDNAML
ncbi:MAG TPA: hypothetical protein VJL83_01940, partial [Patescibacteria group bacterium]|nr:hypothetical protein [Patescibacteria group bacterium]